MPNTREKLIELLDEIACKTDDERCQKCVEQDCVRCAYENIADHLIANGVTVQEWISVKDRLPEIGQRCLCYKEAHGYPSYRLGTYIGTSFSENCAAFKSLSHYGCIGATHWMPLPQPPKGE